MFVICGASTQADPMCEQGAIMMPDADLLSQVITRLHWFGPSDRPVAGWLSTSHKSCGKSGVVILPPIGYEYWTTHRTLRTLAEELARSGHTVLRIDYSGTGDSAGNQWDADLLSSWKQNVSDSIEALRQLGAETIALVGLRLGAALALAMAEKVGADAVVAWVPVVSGRRYVKEMHLMSVTAPAGVHTKGGAGARFLAGCVFTAEMLADLAALSVDDVRITARVLLLDRDDREPNKKLSGQLSTAGATVQHLCLGDAGKMLDLPTEYAVVPTGQVQAVVDWLMPTDMGAGVIPETNRQAQLSVDGVTVIESEVRLGRHQLVGIESRPQDASHAATVVFLNSGSELHAGPGRAWVELSRRLAVAGHRAIRVDFRGWGESPDEGHAPGRPYELHTVADIQNIVAALRERGDGIIVLVGLCAGSWVALHQGGHLPVNGIVAFNPQLYWQVGDPVYATMAEDKAWRLTEVEKNPKWAAAARAAAEKRFDDISRFGFPVDFWYARDDEGMKFIRGPLGKKDQSQMQSGSLTIRELPGLDHAMHLHWHRAEAFDAISGMLQRVGPKP